MQQLSEPQPSLGQLFSELARDTGTLVRKEVELAKVEMTTKAKVAGRDAALVAAGGAIAVVGGLALVAALILVIGTAIPLWASALLVGAMVSTTGAVLVVMGLRAFKELDPKPRETIETLQEDKQWLRQQVSR
jgi:hypothetical protein